MEPGMIALASLAAVGGVIGLLALVTHVYEWRITSSESKKKQAKADLEKASLASPSFSDPRTLVRVITMADARKKATVVPSNIQKSPLAASPTYAPLASPTSPMSRLSTTSGSFGDILIITSPILPSAPELAHSPVSSCSMPSPVTPFTPMTPYLTSPSTSARPCLLAGTSVSQPWQGPSPPSYKNDPYTHLAPRVIGSRMRRYASPPRHLRVTIPDRNTKPFERSHRKLPSDIVITAPPRVLARSISELIGDDSQEEPEPGNNAIVRSLTAIDELRATEKNVNEVGRFGW